MRNKAFTDGFWEKQTGKTLDELWKNYSQAPSL